MALHINKTNITFALAQQIFATSRVRPQKLMLSCSCTLKSSGIDNGQCRIFFALKLAYIMNIIKTSKCLTRCRREEAVTSSDNSNDAGGTVSFDKAVDDACIALGADAPSVGLTTSSGSSVASLPRGGDADSGERVDDALSE